MDAHTVEVSGETIKAKHIMVRPVPIPLFLLFLELNLAASDDALCLRGKAFTTSVAIVELAIAVELAGVLPCP